MPFPYYARLSARGQAIYRQSDRIAEIPLPLIEGLPAHVAALREALAADNRRDVERSAVALVGALLGGLGVTAIRVRVLAVRPRDKNMELHGLYTYDEGAPPEIRVWMRTARHRRVVAFRSFLRTLLHEVCHHLDFRHLKLADSYHTEGFFRRESSLFRQLVPVSAASTPTLPRTRAKKPAPAVGVARPEPAQRKPPRQGRLPFD
jgi:hypothetical protein